MAIDLNHTIIDSHDARRAAEWTSEILGLPAPRTFAHFQMVETDNEVSLDFSDVPTDQVIQSRHLAFLISEDEFDVIFDRVTERGIEYYADPAGRRAHEINHGDGGRGFYFASPDGHWYEVLTRPYGSSLTST